MSFGFSAFYAQQSGVHLGLPHQTSMSRPRANVQPPLQKYEVCQHYALWIIFMRSCLAFESSQVLSHVQNLSKAPATYQMAIRVHRLLTGGNVDKLLSTIFRDWRQHCDTIHADARVFDMYDAFEIDVEEVRQELERFDQSQLDGNPLLLRDYKVVARWVSSVATALGAIFKPLAPPTILKKHQAPVATVIPGQQRRSILDILSQIFRFKVPS